MTAVRSNRREEVTMMMIRCARRAVIGAVALALIAVTAAAEPLLPMSQISFNEAGGIEIESFGNQPFRVMNVAPEKVQGK